MNTITIAGKSVSYHFGLHFSEQFPKALQSLGEGHSRMDFITEAITAAHENFCKMNAEPLVVRRHEVFAFAEQMTSSEEIAMQIKVFLDDYADSDFGKAADKLAQELESSIDAGKKKVQKRSKSIGEK